jgi:hypothetical protein
MNPLLQQSAVTARMSSRDFSPAIPDCPNTSITDVLISLTTCGRPSRRMTDAAQVVAVDERVHANGQRHRLAAQDRLGGTAVRDRLVLRTGHAGQRRLARGPRVVDAAHRRGRGNDLELHLREL